MIFGRSGTTMLVTLGQILLLADVLQFAQGDIIVPDLVIERNRSSVAGKRDDAGDSGWVAVTGWKSFLLHTATCGTSTVESEITSAATKRDTETVSVSDATKAMFADILDDILEINRGAVDTIETIASAWNKMDQRKDLTAKEKSQVDFYMAMYGTFKETDSTGMDRAEERILQLEDFANKYVEGLDKDSFNIRIICGTSAWELGDYDDENGVEQEGWMLDDGARTYVFKRGGTSQNNICQNDKGKSTSLAFMMAGNDGHDYMTICPLGWDKFEEATPIPVQKAKSLSDLEYEDMDDIVKSTLDATVVHELTHSNSFWGTAQTNDEALDDGTTAYGFDKIVELAKQGNSESDASKLRSFKNADTYTYWAVGAYITQCDWSTGSCMNPADLMF
ncbi:uncharacterized protein N7484_005343 [Penicillium longicatenatum]|uniref:uncharacterized protein n=1 Tax=Penicillium longicatenatum TaxID=1561947 RepID=UPI00254723AF|nr:uncharacterized protein N7484_005343 [Penicillium longicatenatum]KAJ5651620.1 hypothetical protein N7484_005343 [Penicillium longicatenatum]